MLTKLKAYYTELVDRAVKSAAQGALLALGADKLNVLDADWKVVGGFAGGAAVLSLLTNLGQRGLFGRGDNSPAPPQVNLTVDGKVLQSELLKLKRRNGGKGLGLG